MNKQTGELRSPLSEVLNRAIGALKHHTGMAARDHFETFVQEMSEGFYRSSLDGAQLMANATLVKLNGYDTEAEMLAAVGDIGTEWYVGPTRRDEFITLLHKHGQVQDFVSEIYRHKTRERIWITENARIVYNRFGQPSHYEGTVRECTDTVERLRLENSYRTYAEHVPGALVQSTYERGGLFTIPFASPRFHEMLGELPGDVKKDARFLWNMVPLQDLERASRSHKKAMETMTDWSCEYRFRRMDNKQIWLSMKATPERRADGTMIWHGFLADISDRKKSEERLHQLAFTDSLTGLPNRRAITDAIKHTVDQCRRHGRHGAVMYVDLDSFKTLNDGLGHVCGDEMLVEIAQRLTNCIGSEGKVARLAGDEFAILLQELPADETAARTMAARMANLVGQVVDQNIDLSGGPFQTTCSIGIALLDADSGRAFELLRRANTAMFAAKKEGRNCAVFYSETLQQAADRNFGLMADLRKALREGALKLHYQMQVDRAGKVVGAEGLLRWFHPTKGLVNPGQFIEQAEANGLIIPLTEWVFDEAVATLTAWQKDDALQDLSLSVNVSAQQFHQPGFLDRMRAYAARPQFDSTKLVLEMTEHVLTHDTGQVGRVMAALRQLGYRFSLDDFGTGYSSLTHLRDLPFDEVKIDGKFICDLENDGRDRALVRSILAMAKALDLRTVAEWVESERQEAFLMEEGCDVMQGFLYGPALDHCAFVKAFTQRQAWLENGDRRTKLLASS
ncbi:MAG: EAL domain-containing protein [Pseudomonadota bacterium]